ncbi:MAG: hypothetical protein HXY38_05640 [Chloroflexi bacterium]|nr:hypothetical protein [Chloroflexota bacterium]
MPGAESTSLQEGASGTQGHTVEIACSFPDGSTDIIDNGEYAIAAIGGGFLIGLFISLPLFLIPFFLIRKKKS